MLIAENTIPYQNLSQLSNNIFLVGINSVAIEFLQGRIVYISLPKIDTTVLKQEICGFIETDKKVLDIVSPVTGKIIKINEEFTTLFKQKTTSKLKVYPLFHVQLF